MSPLQYLRCGRAAVIWAAAATDDVGEGEAVCTWLPWWRLLGGCWDLGAGAGASTAAGVMLANGCPRGFCLLAWWRGA